MTKRLAARKIPAPRATLRAVMASPSISGTSIPITAPVAAQANAWRTESNRGARTSGRA